MEKCKCGKKAELKVMIDSEDPLEKPISITEIASGVVASLKLGIVTNVAYLYMCKECFNKTK